MTSSFPTPVEIFEQVLLATQSGEVQAMLDLCADDVVFEFPFAPAGRPRSGVRSRSAGTSPPSRRESSSMA